MVASVPKIQLIQALVFRFLLADILPNYVFIPSHRGHEEASRPEMLSRGITTVLAIVPGQMDRALPFDVTNHLGHGVFGRYRNQHMHVVRLQVSFENLALLLGGKPPENFAKMFPQLPVQNFPPTLGNEDHMVLALPFRVA
jgi:hypothetical protein